MSNDIKSRSQPAPAALGRSPRRVNISHPADIPHRVGAADGFNVARVFRPEALDLSGRSAAFELPIQIMSRLRKFADPSLTKYKWSRPLLIDSALQTEFGVTYRKQTTEKFLTEARTHISVFRKLPNLSSVFCCEESSKTLHRASAKHPPISRLLAAPLRPFLPNISALKTAFSTRF
jgi:hypothetical protein